MTTRLADLPKHLKSIEVFFIGSGSADELQSLKPALIDGSKNSTGQDMALLFSSSDRAFTYRNRFPSLSDLDVFQATVNEMIEIFDGKVMYFVVDPAGFCIRAVPDGQ